MKLYSRNQAADVLGCHPQTVKEKCQLLYDNEDICKVDGKTIITETGIEKIRAILNPVGFPKGKKRTKRAVT